MKDDPITLIHAYLDGDLTDDQHRALSVWLQEAPGNVDCFVAECRIHSELRDLHHLSQEMPANDEATIIIHPAPILHASFFNVDSPVGGMLFSYAVSLLLVCSGMFFGWMWKVSETQSVAAKTNVTAPAGHLPPFVPKMALVGRITGMIDCVFSDDKDILPPPSRTAFVPLGRRYKLKSGLMEITYDVGAKVILQGPVTYEVDSANGGYLSFGKLTARIEKKGEISANLHSAVNNHQQSAFPLSPLPSPLFSVRTPLAVVTDLGTEFGVECNSSGATRSHVFQGRVELRVASENGESGQAISLEENESARVEVAGNHVVKVTLGGSSPKALSTAFMRHIPKPLFFNFDDGSSQGWTPILGLAGDAVESFQVTDNQTPYYAEAIHEPAQSPSYFVSSLISRLAHEKRDDEHHTATFRSPPFILDGWGNLSFYLYGGNSGGPLVKNISEIPLNSKSDGFIGVALERVSDGALVLSKSRGFGGDDWLRLSFTTEELAPYVQNGFYRLVLIDYKHGLWGWCALDSVRIPGHVVKPSPPLKKQQGKEEKPKIDSH